MFGISICESSLYISDLSWRIESEAHSAHGGGGSERPGAVCRIICLQMIDEKDLSQASVILGSRFNKGI